MRTVMSRTHANGIEIEYRTLGHPHAPPILLIMGLGGQLTRWPEALCHGLAEAGYYVILYDNRDVGLSSRISGGRQPSLLREALRAQLGLPVRALYTLEDMARDAVGLLGALGIERAHIVAVSMGAMIGQILAAQHSERVRSFVCIMSSSGSRRLPQARLGLRLKLLRPSPPGREARIRHVTGVLRHISSPAFPPDERELRTRVARDYDRSPDQRGVPRQLLAIMASGSRGVLVRRIRVPTLILHGADDPLVPVAAARDLHRRIPGSRLEIIPGMGHDLPAALLPDITHRILEHVRSADARAAAPAAAPPEAATPTR